MRNPAAQGRRDANHGEIVKRYEELYCNVIDLSHVGLGVPDIIVAFSGFCAPREIKTDEGHLRPSQLTFHKTWRGPKIKVIRSIIEVDLDVQEIREKISRRKFV